VWSDSIPVFWMRVPFLVRSSPSGVPPPPGVDTNDDWVWVTSTSPFLGKSAENTAAYESFQTMGGFTIPLERS
jgi:hypothetical protein